MTHVAQTGTASYLKKAGALCLAFSLAACATVPSGPALTSAPGPDAASQPKEAPVQANEQPAEQPRPEATPEPAPESTPESTPEPAPKSSATLRVSSIRLGVTVPGFDVPETLAQKRDVDLAAAAGRRYPCRSAILTDMNGTVLLENNAGANRYPASVTKVMTLIMVFDAIHRGELKLTDKITFSAHAASRERTNLGLARGAQVSVEDGIRALVIHSANDMATAFGEHLAGGSEARFAQMMTAKARQIGMKNTVFKNASGLPNPQMLTTAQDMAMMGRYLVRNYPNEYHYFSDRQFTYRGTTYRNHNPSLRTYTGVDGIKTGFTRASLFNIVVSAQRPEGRLMVAVFGCPSTPIRTQEVESLLDHGFKVLRARQATPQAAPATSDPASNPGPAPAGL